MKRILSILLVITMILAGVVGCSDDTSDQQGSSNDGEQSSEKRDTVIVANSREATTLNPHGSNDAGTSFVTSLIYDTLLKFDKDMNLMPSLATEWNKVSPTLYSFTLRDDVTFHNGDKFTAQDVMNTLELVTVSPATSSVLGVIDVANCKVVSDTEIEIALKEPFAPFLNYMAMSISGIINLAALEAGGESYDENPVGTGPFKYKSWTSGDVMELEANNEYWGEEINFNTLVIRLVPEATTRAIEVETGGVDIGMSLAANDVSNLAENPDVTVLSENILNTSYLSFNCSKAPFDDARVRQAITHVVDAATIIKNSTFGLADQSFSPIAPGVWGYHNAGEIYGLDVEKAKTLLAEAGYPDGFQTSITITSSNQMQAEMIQSMLGQIGIEVEILSLDFAGWLDSLVTGKQEMYIGGWTTSSADAAYGLDVFHSEKHGSGGNRSFYTNADLDAKLEAASAESDEETRKEMYKEIQEIIAEEAVYVNLGVGQTHIATSNEIENIYFIPTQALRFSLLEFK